MVHRLSSILDRQLLGRVLISAGLSILLLWPLRTTIAALVYNNVGSVYLNRALLAPELAPEERVNRAVEAGQAFQTALTWDPLNGQAYYNLGALYDSWDGYLSTGWVWSRAAALEPRDPNTRFAHGQALAAQDRRRAPSRNGGPPERPSIL